ncbi:ketol-acid reductoisomerase, partial [Pseudomonas sp. FW305-E2]
MGTIRSSFMEETKADLLSEQAVLCGPVPRLVEECVKFLTDKGVNPRIATYECLNELKLIVDMMVDYGIHGMYQKISTAAKFGGLHA